MTAGQPAGGAAPDPVRTVIVDDAAELRALLNIVLRRSERYDVVGEAGDGAAGVDEVIRTRPDLVLLDLSMPGMDGLEALPRIKAAVPDATIVVLSGYQAERAAAPALAAGAAGYLEKGLSPAELVAALDRILGIGAAPAPQRTSEPPLDVSPAELVASAVRELRSPLAAARGFLDLVVDDLHVDADRVGEYVGHSRSALDGLDSMLEAFVRYVRETSRSLDLVAVPLDPIVADVVEEFARVDAAGEPTVALVRPLPTVRGDRAALAVVLQHLLDNAVRHGQRPVTVSGGDDGKTGWVSIADAGPRLPADDVLWQPFRRGPTAADSDAGLGLPLCARLLRAMGGSVRAEELPGHGVRFQLRLPVPRP